MKLTDIFTATNFNPPCSNTNKPQLAAERFTKAVRDIANQRQADTTKQSSPPINTIFSATQLKEKPRLALRVIGNYLIKKFHKIGELSSLFDTLNDLEKTDEYKERNKDDWNEVTSMYWYAVNNSFDKEGALNYLLTLPKNDIDLFFEILKTARREASLNQTNASTNCEIAEQPPTKRQRF